MSQSRAAYRVDANQFDIIQALRRIGASVTVTAGLGHGFPDLVVGYRGRNYLAEVKTSAQAPWTEDEIKWRETWHGSMCIWYTPEQAISDVMDDLQEMEY